MNDGSAVTETTETNSARTEKPPVAVRITPGAPWAAARTRKLRAVRSAVESGESVTVIADVTSPGASATWPWLNCPVRPGESPSRLKTYVVVALPRLRTRSVNVAGE